MFILLEIKSVYEYARGQVISRSSTMYEMQLQLQSLDSASKFTQTQEKLIARIIIHQRLRHVVSEAWWTLQFPQE